MGAHTSQLLGYGWQEFKANIEAKLQPWMTWDNHGEWVVDHVLPLSWMVRHGITSPAVVNALDNLRPIDKRTNSLKHAQLLLGAYTPLSIAPHVRDAARQAA